MPPLPIPREQEMSFVITALEEAAPQFAAYQEARRAEQAAAADMRAGLHDRTTEAFLRLQKEIWNSLSRQEPLRYTDKSGKGKDKDGEFTPEAIHEYDNEEVEYTPEQRQDHERRISRKKLSERTIDILLPAFEPEPAQPLPQPTRLNDPRMEGTARLQDALKKGIHDRQQLIKVVGDLVRIGPQGANAYQLQSAHKTLAEFKAALQKRIAAGPVRPEADAALKQAQGNLEKAYNVSRKPVRDAVAALLDDTAKKDERLIDAILSYMEESPAPPAAGGTPTSMQAPKPRTKAPVLHA